MKRWSCAWQHALPGNAAPAVEPKGRRKRIDPWTKLFFRVFSKIREYVDERISHLSRRRELSSMPAVGPKSPAPHDELVDGACDANRDAAYAPRQSSLVARFDDHVQVVP